MPRSFLVKKVKCDDDRAAYHSYKFRDLYDDSVESVKAVAPYTPSTEPLAAIINNASKTEQPFRCNDLGVQNEPVYGDSRWIGYIHDVISPSVPESSVLGEQDNSIENHIYPREEPESSTLDNSDSGSDASGSKFNNGVTIGYTYDAFFISDGRSRRRNPLVALSEKISRQRYTCNECGKDYATSSNLSRHKQTHRSLESTQAKKCPHCEKVYVSMPALSMHVLTHDLKHRCDMCGKFFSRPWLLQGHMRSHTGDKPFGCAHCGKAFADRSNLRAHMQTHSAFKEYKCKRCDKSFALKSYLNKHYESACIKE